MMTRGIIMGRPVDLAVVNRKRGFIALRFFNGDDIKIRNFG
jgi:hypothetical protein